MMTEMTVFDYKSLYHYTSFQALEGILKDKEIWLGNLNYMNDRKEMKYFFESLKETIVDDFPGFSVTTESLFTKQLLRFENETAYAFSMSSQDDDASQWDRYADGGRGVCIKFSVEELTKKIKGKATLQHVYYAENMKNHQIKALIELYLTKGVIGNDFKSIDAIFENAWSCSVAFKHPSFKAENEVRICSYPFLFKKLKSCDMRYCISNAGLREYYPLSLCEEIKRDYGGCIEEIILGPCSGVDKNMFYRYLQFIGADVNAFSISESKCPLR